MTTERQKMDVDIVCVGFGPASAGFLTTLTRAIQQDPTAPHFQSKVMPGMPLQVICYERADDIGFGVSGIVTEAKGIKASFTAEELSQIPMAHPVKHEEVYYLLDPVGASRRSWLLKMADFFLRIFKCILPWFKNEAFQLPFIPPFMAKHGGYVFSMGQFTQWLGSNLMGSGLVQIWPSMPVREPLFDSNRVVGVRLVDQGVEKSGKPTGAFMPGMDIHAALTVVGDGPYGPVGQNLDQKFGLPEGNHQREWALGMKAVVELPETTALKPGTVIHTFGYPEPEIFGFLYVYPNRMASLGIFIPSWLKNPMRTGYRYLQHWMQHPTLWKHLQGATLKSWGGKSLQEAGKRGEPFIVGDGFARIGEGSGSTNMLKGSGVDEAWTTGVQLAEGVIEILKTGKTFTKENLEETYLKRRRASWVEQEGNIAKKARDGFQHSFELGFMGMGISGFTNGTIHIPAKLKPVYEHVPSLEKYYQGRVAVDRIEKACKEANATNTSMHDALMDAAGWPAIQYDGKLLISHQDALLLGGKVQAAEGYADHVLFLDGRKCEKCSTKICIEMCSGQAITANSDGTVPLFDREKCIHCAACLWNCAYAREQGSELTNVDFRAGSGGLHSNIN
ncbi:MAG TPA: 4Fe-4S ferredoxin [Candidatus Omnitrophota bacterium]|nr:4Fe-4S ferredoxin [Candidatus Omnitrophota bacterium]